MIKAEAELVRRCRNGEEPAWEELYGTYKNHVIRILSWGKWRFSKQEIEDMCQEIFLELSKCLPKFRGDSSLSTFIAHITKNRCISQIRKLTAQKRPRENLFSFQNEETGDSIIFDPPDPDPGPEEMTITTIEIRSIHDAINSMSNDCKEILEMRFFRDLDYDKISGEIGVPIGTVCSRLKRCLLKFRSLVEQKFPDLRQNR